MTRRPEADYVFTDGAHVVRTGREDPLVIDSFPAQLAAPAVLRRPDVFHAAVAGAPVTDWRLYDTHASEAAHEEIAGNLLLLQRDFLREALARGAR